VTAVTDRDRNNEPGEWRYPSGSDTWLFVDAVVTLLTAAITIVIVILRHPLTLLAIAICVGLVGEVAGWW
jgi:hypothetical protein